MCDVFVDNEPYYPGQAVTGRVECFFTTETKIKSIQVRFEGNGHVQFGMKNPIVRDERYCCIEIDVTKNEGKPIPCPAGRYTYSFTFDLPHKIPGSIQLDHGYISYWITAIIDLIEESPIKLRKKVAIGSCLDLNAFAVCKNPVSRTECKNMIYILLKTPAITLDVSLPQGGYVPSQTITFVASVQNMSEVNISAVRFRLVQVLKMLTEEFQQQQTKSLGKEQDIPGGEVAPGTKKSWEVQLRIPSNTLAVNLAGCKIIKIHCELRGVAVLPFPHRDLKIKVPFLLGTVPIKSTVAA